MALEYWLRGCVPPGPIKATVISDFKRVAELLNQFRGSSAILVGSALKTVEKLVGEDVLEKIVRLSKALQAPIVTYDMEVVRRLDEVGFTNYSIEFPLEFVRKLSRGVLSYRLLVLIGLRYYYAWLLLNHLKHYKPNISTLSLDPYAQPNATWTLPSLPPQVWVKNLVQVIDVLNSSTLQT